MSAADGFLIVLWVLAGLAFNARSAHTERRLASLEVWRYFGKHPAFFNDAEVERLAKMLDREIQHIAKVRAKAGRE